MPNIEVHGLSERGAAGMSGEIAKILIKTPLAKEVVISAMNDVVADLVPSDRPYLRVVCTTAAEAQQVVDLLKPLNIDIEVLLLHAFMPATQ